MAFFNRLVELAMNLAHYDLRQSYDWNYEHAPPVVACDIPPVPGVWKFCRRRVESPLGIAAGPLLNGRWCLYYAALGFDVLTYKTVRGVPRACPPPPNLVPVSCGPLCGGEHDLPACDELTGSWAASFGMPSSAPSVWTADIAETRRRLPTHKLLSVSVVGSLHPSWSTSQLAADYADCARMASCHGADCLEINLAVPNTSLHSGQLYEHPASASTIVRQVRAVIGAKPLIAKVGSFHDADDIGRLIDAIASDASAIVAPYSVAATVVDGAGHSHFDGAARGICGRAILAASLKQTEAVADYIARHQLALCVIGSGGAFTADDVRRYLAAGAESVHLATAVMTDPMVGIRIRGQLQSTA